MSSPSLRTPADALRDERGAALATVVLISMLVGALGALALNTSDQAQRSSARDRNHEIALGVAEAGIHHAMAEIDRYVQDDGILTMPSCLTPPLSEDLCEEPLNTPQGDGFVKYRRVLGGYEIDSTGSSGGDSLGRSRRILAEVRPPPLFPDARFALFSFTSVVLSNSNKVLEGDVWANDSVTLGGGGPDGTLVRGSVTSAQSYVELKSNATIEGDARAGGFHGTGWAIQLHNTAEISGSATVPGSAENCDPEGAVAGNGSIGEGILCEPPPVPRHLPPFAFDHNNYETINNSSSSIYEPWTVNQFDDFLDAGNRESLSGTFHILDPTNTVDLSGVSLSGSTTIVTDARIFAQNFNDAGVDAETGAILVLVSHYAAPPGGCGTQGPADDCAIQLKNNFQMDPDCKTVSLIYADQGPIALKNNNQSNLPDLCGSVIGTNIETKNNQNFEYRDEIERIPGFHPGSYEIARWVELPVDADLPE